jgi:hypothetical protein
MKKLMVGLIAISIATSAMAVEGTALGVPEMSKWNATHYVGVSYADLAGQTVTNSALTLTNVMGIAAGESCELVAYVLDQAFDCVHTVNGTNNWTNSIALTVTSAGGTNSYMASTEICEDSTEVWVKTPWVPSTLTYLSAATFSPGGYGTNFCTSATTSTLAIVTTPVANKYNSAANFVNVTITPTDTPDPLSDNTQGKFRLFFRKHKTRD